MESHEVINFNDTSAVKQDVSDKHFVIKKIITFLKLTLASQHKAIDSFFVIKPVIY